MLIDIKMERQPKGEILHTPPTTTPHPRLVPTYLCEFRHDHRGAEPVPVVGPDEGPEGLEEGDGHVGVPHVPGVGQGGAVGVDEWVGVYVWV